MPCVNSERHENLRHLKFNSCFILTPHQHDCWLILNMILFFSSILSLPLFLSRFTYFVPCVVVSYSRPPCKALLPEDYASLLALVNVSPSAPSSTCDCLSLLFFSNFPNVFNWLLRLLLVFLPYCYQVGTAPQQIAIPTQSEQRCHPAPPLHIPKSHARCHK